MSLFDAISMMIFHPFVINLSSHVAPKLTVIRDREFLARNTE